MSERFIFRLVPGDPERVEWLRTDREGKAIGDPKRGSPKELAEQAKREPLILLLPGDDVLLTRVHLPPGNARQLANAIPFAVEEQVAEDVEQLYIVHGRREENGTAPVAIVRREWLNALLQRLEEAGVRPAWAIPEPLLLPVETGCWSLLEDGGRITLRHGESGGLGVEREAALPLFKRLLQEREDEGRPEVRVWCRQENTDIQEFLESSGCKIHLSSLPENSLRVFQPLPGKRPQLDLMRKIQRDVHGSSARRPIWKSAAALLTMAFVVYLGSAGFQYRRLSMERERLTAEIDSVFREAFPQVQRVVRPMVQAEQELQKRRRIHGRGGDSFLSMLYQFGQALKKQNPTKLTGLEFRNGVMQVQLEGRNISQIEALKGIVEKQGVFETEIISAVSREKGVAAKLRISRVSL